MCSQQVEAGVRSFLTQLDQAYDHRWESLHDSLRGLTLEEACWQADCYRNESPAPDSPLVGAPPSGSILSVLLHLAECKQSYTQQLAQVIKENVNSIQLSGDGLVEAFDFLRASHKAQRGVICCLRDCQLEWPMADGVLIHEFLATTIRHDIWHAGQLALLRRLFRQRN